MINSKVFIIGYPTLPLTGDSSPMAACRLELSVDSWAPHQVQASQGRATSKADFVNKEVLKTALIMNVMY